MIGKGDTSEKKKWNDRLKNGRKEKNKKRRIGEKAYEHY